MSYFTFVGFFSFLFQITTDYSTFVSFRYILLELTKTIESNGKKEVKEKSY